MKLIIAGSRHLRVSFNFIKGLLITQDIPIEKIQEIVQGEAQGIDHCAKMFAMKAGIPHKPFPYKSELGKAGGPVRNAEMAEYADALLLIWDGVSRGSKNMKFEARKRNIPVFEIILHSPTQEERKKLGIYVKPKDRQGTINRSNEQTYINPGALA